MIPIFPSQVLSSKRLLSAVRSLALVSGLAVGAAAAQTVDDADVITDTGQSLEEILNSVSDGQSVGRFSGLLGPGSARLTASSLPELQALIDGAECDAGCEIELSCSELVSTKPADGVPVIAITDRTDIHIRGCGADATRIRWVVSSNEVATSLVLISGQSERVSLTKLALEVEGLNTPGSALARSIVRVTESATDVKIADSHIAVRGGGTSGPSPAMGIVVDGLDTTINTSEDRVPTTKRISIVGNHFDGFSTLLNLFACADCSVARNTFSGNDRLRTSALVIKRFGRGVRFSDNTFDCVRQPPGPLSCLTLGYKGLVNEYAEVNGNTFIVHDSDAQPVNGIFLFSYDFARITGNTFHCLGEPTCSGRGVRVSGIGVGSENSLIANNLFINFQDTQLNTLFDSCPILLRADATTSRENVFVGNTFDLHDATGARLATGDGFCGPGVASGQVESNYVGFNVVLGGIVPASAYVPVESGPPPAEACDSDLRRQQPPRLDVENNRLYVCAGAARGWDFIPLSD